MALKFTVDDIKDVPEPLRSLYEAKEGKFVLATEGDHPEVETLRQKVTRFRDDNINKGKELDALKARMESVKDIDPEEHRRLKSQFEELKKKGVDKGDDVEAKINASIADFSEKHLKPLQKRLETSEKVAKERQEKLNKARMREVVGKLAIDAKVRPDALDFVLGKAENDFEVTDEGDVKAREGRFSQKTNHETDPITPGEWIAIKVKEHPFAFEVSNGGGAGGSSSGVGIRTGNTLVNPTPEQLGDPQISKEIKEGRLKIVHTARQ